MRWSAAAGDTWGISGTAFIGFYLLLILAALGFALAWRRAVRARDADPPARDLTAGEAGYLAAGPRRAVLAEVGLLRAAGALTADRGTFAHAGSPPAGLDDLGTAVFNAALQQTRASLQRHSWVRAALADLHRDLGRAGLVLDAQARARARIAGWVMLAVAALGIVRTVAGVGNDRPVTYVVLATIGAALAGAYLVAVLPRRTRAGDRALAALRTRYEHLAPTRHPAWSAYGAAAAGISVGIFGSAALYAGDPTFATQAAISRDGIWAGGSSGGSGCGGGGESGSGSSGCGGGGCGGGGCGG